VSKDDEVDASLREASAARELYRCPKCRRLPSVVPSSDARTIRLRRACSCVLRLVIMEVGSGDEK
jgi:hypothetical protein